MTHPAGVGMWLRNPSNMIVTIEDANGVLIGQYDKDTPGHINPIADVQLELDGLGLLTGGTVNCTQRMFLLPFSLTIRIAVVDDVMGLINVAEGYVENVSPSPTDNQTSIPLVPLENLAINDLFTGYLPFEIKGVVTDHINLLGSAQYVLEPGKSYTNAEVLAQISDNEPQLTFGVDGNRRAIMGVPGGGTPVIIPTYEMLTLTPKEHIINQYTTHLKSTAPPGWRSYEAERDLGPLVPKVFKDLGAPKTEEITGPTGPTWKVNVIRAIARIKMTTGNSV